MSFCYFMASYRTSVNYEQLLAIMPTYAVICLIPSGGAIPDVARTYMPYYDDDKIEPEYWVVSRGVQYITASSKEEFIAQCKSSRLRFVVPIGDCSKPDLAVNFHEEEKQ